MGISKLNVGIIGAGRMGITHYSIINSHPDITISSVADPSGLILSMMKKYLPIKTYKDYNDLLKDDKPDAVLVCTPPNLHYDILIKALQSNVHVFVEKPYTTNLAQSRELAEKYKQRGLVNQVGYVNRFNDVFVEVKRLIKENLLGKVLRFRSEMFSGTVIKPEEGSGWRGARESGGGAIYEMASHAIDLMNYIIGKPEKITGSSMNSVYSKNVEDIVSSTFLYKSGCVGSIYVNWSDESYRKPSNKIEIFGTKGRIQADQHGFKVYLKERNDEYGYREGWNTRYITDVFRNVPFYVRGNEFTSQLYHFVDCIQNKSTKNVCSFGDGADTQEVIHKIFTDFENNGKV
jgi:predicted dehydrogenase